MKFEYDKCEEYWLSKLEDEREAYNEEQKLSDERLTELISKITEYEEQFASKTNNSTLPTIDEKYSLEVQFSDLEDEFEKYKKENQQELKNKLDEIEKLKEKITSLENSKCNHAQSPNNTNWEKKDGSTTSSPIAYLWNQGTIHTPFVKENDGKVSSNDYQNLTFMHSGQGHKFDENIRCSSDSEKERGLLKPIQRPALAQRSSSVGTLRDDAQDGKKQPNMIHCADLEGHLRRHHMHTVSI